MPSNFIIRNKGTYSIHFLSENLIQLMASSWPLKTFFWMSEIEYILIKFTDNPMERILLETMERRIWSMANLITQRKKRKLSDNFVMLLPPLDLQTDWNLHLTSLTCLQVQWKIYPHYYKTHNFHCSSGSLTSPTFSLKLSTPNQSLILSSLLDHYHQHAKTSFYLKHTCDSHILIWPHIFSNYWPISQFSSWKT